LAEALPAIKPDEGANLRLQAGRAAANRAASPADTAPWRAAGAISERA